MKKDGLFDFDGFDGFDFGFDFGSDDEKKEKEGKEEQVNAEDVLAAKKTRRRTKECTELSLKYLYRRAFSEVSMLDAMKHVRLENGCSYNFITAGDVDSLSFLKVVLNQHKLTYLLASTWCMAAEDILQLAQWYEGGNWENGYIRWRNISKFIQNRMGNAKGLLQ